MNYMTPEELEVCWEVRRMCACDQLRRVTRGVTQVYDDAVVASGLRITQLPIFVGLASEGDLSLSVLADRLALDRTTLTRNLKVLEDRGLILTYEHADDARVRMVAMTLEGSALLTGALERWAKVQEFVEERFGRERLVALESELSAFSKALST
ncbi:MAG: MarR family winged helix-turn-helix transcriptional regulator [Solirubrobacteraceae bacterium]|nr:MarR family winged helix-turn-helix transcriptional regulator [Solirubrobacteraceae bacterium]